MKGRKTLAYLFLGLAAMVAFGLWVDARADLRAGRVEAKLPPEGRFVEVDGIPVHAVELGTRGPFVVLIHGASGNARDFTFDFAHRLAQSYRVIVFDRPGHGYSGRIGDFGALDPRAEAPEAQAQVLSDAAALLGATRPIVVGHSYGGAVALAWALDRPASAVVLVAGVALPWPGGLGWTYDVIGNRLGGALLPPLAAAFLPEPYLEANLRGVFAPDPVPPGYRDGGGVDLATRAEAIRANGRQVARLRPFVVAQSDRYDTLSLPIEIVHGTADTIVPADIHAVPLAAMLDTADLTLVEDMGHMPHHTHTEVVLAAIDRAASRAGLQPARQGLD